MANIIITGANQGIGYYFTEQALKDGNKVAVLDVETDKLEALAQAFPKQLLYYNTDVCDEIQINSAVKEIIAAFHFIDIAIHNACLCTFDNECSIDLDIYKQVFNVNYYGGLRFAKSVIPYMQAQKRGKIIFTSSGVGVTGFIGISPYASTKGALESLAKCLNIEYASDGISFHIIHPPLTRTKSASPLPVPKEFMADPQKVGFGIAKHTLTARLQHQLLKLRNILTAQNQMLAQEKEQIKTLISDISHQIKTPVSAANTFAQLLDDKELSDEERSEYIATLQTSLEKLTFLTNSLIKMSRLESGIISLKPEKNSLNDIVLQAVKTVYAKAKEKNITITFDCEQNFEAMLDFNWTAEAITNILDNAVKYTPSGGIVGLEITEYPSYLRLDISDNGIGIPEEEQAKIFGRFYRGKQSAGIDGVGIGLYLTRDIINKQKGYIKVASDENGSVFSLFLKKD